MRELNRICSSCLLFKEGKLPFKYLGVPLTRKRHNIAHYLPLNDRIQSRIKHWTSKLLSYAGRIKLVSSISFATIQYWMQRFPLPKFFLHNIEAMCRSYIWSGSQDIKRKSHVAWSSVCKLAHQGGLTIFNLTTWNKVCMMKCLWNLCRKSDNLWVKRVHNYYVKTVDIMTVRCGQSWSWMMSNILQQTKQINSVHTVWNKMLQCMKFVMKEIYIPLIDGNIRVPLRFMLKNNIARPRALLAFRLVCHGKFATKERLKWFGLIQEGIWSLCEEVEEMINHLFFDCRIRKNIWTAILTWMEVDHVPKEWSLEKNWAIEYTRKKGWKANILKRALAETINGIWLHRTNIIFS